MCLGHFLAVVLHDYNVKRPGFHVLGRKCGTCMFTFRVFSQAFGFCGFLASFTSTLFSIFNVPRVPRAYFWFPFFSLHLLFLVLFVHVIHFTRSLLFCLVCVPFGSGSRFCWKRNIFVCVYGPGSGFCLKPSIVHVYCKGPFGSGSLFFVWNKLLLARLREPVFFCLERPLGSGSRFCLGLNIIVFAVGPLGSGSLYWDTVRGLFALGAGLESFRPWEPVLLLYGLKPPIWLWYIVDSGSFGFGAEINNI